MELQTIRPNLVQAIRAYRVEDLMTAAQTAGQQPGFVVVLEQLPDNPRFDREAREQLLDVFRDAADFWAERRIPFRCFYSFQ